MLTTNQSNWAVTDEKVQKVVQKIVEVGSPRKIILFGSYIKGTITANSDLDILVITGDEIANPRAESVRIRRALRGVSMPMDIIVITEAQWMKLKNRPGMIYRQALREGRIVYDS